MKILDDGPAGSTTYSFTELVIPSVIKIFAAYSMLVLGFTKYSLSNAFAPILYP